VCWWGGIIDNKTERKHIRFQCHAAISVFWPDCRAFILAGHSKLTKLMEGIADH